MITFAVISGGAGKRFGGDKTRALLDNKELYKYGIELGKSVSDDVMLVSRDSVKYMPYIDDVTYLEDELDNQCPMAGLITAARHAKYDNIFALSADTPLLNTQIVNYICSNIQNYDAIIPEIDGKLWTLATCYKKSTLLQLLPYYEKGHFKLISALNDFNILTISNDDFIKEGINTNHFININTAEDIINAQNIVKV